MPGFLSDLNYRYFELAGSPEINCEPDGLKVVRHLKCDWATAPHLVRELVGFPYRRGNDGAQVRLLPQEFQMPPIDPLAIAAGGVVFPGQYALAPVICTRADIVAFAGSVAIENQAMEQNVYQFAQINATYGSVDYTVGSNPTQPNLATDLDANGLAYFTSVQNKMGGRTVVTPAHTYCWYDEVRNTFEYLPPPAAPDLKALIPEGVPWSLRTIELVAKRHACLARPASFFTPYLNTVNLSPLLGYAPETLLFTGGDSVQAASPAGMVVNEITLNFTHRPEGHNRLPRWNTSSAPLPADTLPPEDSTSFRYQRICRASDATKPLYDLAELRLLWT